MEEESGKLAAGEVGGRVGPLKCPAASWEAQSISQRTGWQLIPVVVGGATPRRSAW